MINTVSEMASLPEIGASDITAHLQLITANLRTGKVRSGVIGLTKAGQSELNGGFLPFLYNMYHTLFRIFLTL